MLIGYYEYCPLKYWKFCYNITTEIVNFELFILNVSFSQSKKKCFLKLNAHSLLPMPAVDQYAWSTWVKVLDGGPLLKVSKLTSFYYVVPGKPRFLEL